MIATPDQIKNIYRQNFGREPSPEELAQHASNETGLEHLRGWAGQKAGNQQPGSQGGQNPIQSFNAALMSKLKEYQGLSSADLIKRKNNILRKMYQKQSQATPEGQRELSPGQQSAVRSGQVSALRPELESTQQQLRDREQARSRFLETMDFARQIGQDQLQLRERQREKAFQGLKIMAQSGTDWSELPPDQVQEIVEYTGTSPNVLEGYYDNLKRASEIEQQLLEQKLSDDSGGWSGGTITERAATQRQNFEGKLNQSKGEDGYVDSQTYQSLRIQYLGGKDEFDEYFADMLSEQEQKNLGISPDEKSEFNLAKEYAIKKYKENSDISEDQLLGDIRSDSEDLSITETRAAIRAAKDEANVGGEDVTLEDMKEDIKKNAEDYKNNVGMTKEENKKRITADLKGQMGYKKDQSLPKSITKIIKEVLNEIYPKEKSWLRKKWKPWENPFKLYDK